MALTKIAETFEEYIGGAVLFADDCEAIGDIVQSTADPQAIAELRSAGERRAWDLERRTVTVWVPGFKLLPSEVGQLPKPPRLLGFLLGSRR
jgi:hypothetical protein